LSKYAVEVAAAARKELEELPDNVLARIVGKLESLADNPRPSGCKKLIG
jgi:mRNA interferase RelE/StbE